MKLNISFPGTGCHNPIEVDDECKLCTFYEKCMATEVAADTLGEERKRYVVWFIGGNNKQGFQMEQGVLTHGLLHLLLIKEHSCCRPKRTGERKRKSIQGCTVDANRSVLNLVMVKKGRKIFLVSLILLCLGAWGPTELAESANFSTHLKKMMSANMSWESP